LTVFPFIFLLTGRAEQNPYNAKRPSGLSGFYADSAPAIDRRSVSDREFRCHTLHCELMSFRFCNILRSFPAWLLHPWQGRDKEPLHRIFNAPWPVHRLPPQKQS